MDTPDRPPVYEATAVDILENRRDWLRRQVDGAAEEIRELEARQNDLGELIRRYSAQQGEITDALAVLEDSRHG